MYSHYPLLVLFSQMFVNQSQNTINEQLILISNSYSGVIQLLPHQFDGVKIL